jgi:hypothetical protein
MGHHKERRRPGAGDGSRWGAACGYVGRRERYDGRDATGGLRKGPVMHAQVRRDGGPNGGSTTIELSSWGEEVRRYSFQIYGETTLEYQGKSEWTENILST